jgi:hypothetical protein
VALINIMPFSLRRTARVVVASSAKQEIRVRSGRDDNFVARVKYFPLKLLRLQKNCHPDRSEA